MATNTLLRSPRSLPFPTSSPVSPSPVSPSPVSPSPLSLSHPTGCQVCGCAHVEIDCVDLQADALELGECPRCGHRWTRPARRPSRFDARPARGARRRAAGGRDESAQKQGRMVPNAA